MPLPTCLPDAWNSSRVLVGPYQRDSTQGPAQWRKIKSKLIPHPNYNVGTKAYDYLMFKIESVTKKNLKPIRLNKSKNNPSQDEKVQAIGMGLNDDGDISTRLEKVTLTAVSHADCKAAWEGNGQIIDETIMVCASTTGGKDVCGGASPEVNTCACVCDCIFLFLECVLRRALTTLRFLGIPAGDSGGPLFDNDEVQIGLVSFGPADRTYIS